MIVIGIVALPEGGGGRGGGSGPLELPGPRRRRRFTPTTGSGYQACATTGWERNGRSVPGRPPFFPVGLRVGGRASIFTEEVQVVNKAKKRLKQLAAERGISRRAAGNIMADRRQSQGRSVEGDEAPPNGDGDHPEQPTVEGGKPRGPG